MAWCRAEIDRPGRLRQSQKHVTICDKSGMPKLPTTVQDRILAHFRRAGPGSVLATRDLLEFGTGPAVRQALTRSVRAGQLRKVARGFYEVPRQDPDIGELAPRVEAVVEALKRRDGIRLLPTGAHAANLLGLSTQVPVRLVFLTDGPTRRIRLGRHEIVLKRTTPRQMATADRISGTVIQALRWIGVEHVDKKVVARLRRDLTPRDRRQLLADQRYAPAWVAEILRRVVENPTKGR